MNYDKILSNIFFIDDWHLNQSYLGKYKRHYKKRDKYQNIITYLENRYIDSESFKETIYRMRHNFKIRPICKTCGNKVKFIGKNNKLYASFCCNRCSGTNKETIEKKQENDRKKHNGKLGWNINTPEKIETRKNTLIQKYGSWNNACKEIEKLHKEGVKRKYGVDSVMKVEIIKEKHNIALKNNFTFNKSKPEDITYELLKEKYSNVIRQYKSDLYPFNCDFYIPNYNDNIIDSGLYIECNYHWTHGFHLYNKDNKDDKLIVEKWKEKNTKYYDNAINTWTDLDIRKYNIAKENKLNYLIFYSFNEFNNWIKEKDSS